MSAANLLGQSLAFPPRIDAGGRIALSSGEANVRESLVVLLRTEPGERVALPGYGVGLGRFLHEPNTPATHARIRHAIEAAVAVHEPRVRVEAIAVAASDDPAEPDAAIATLTYRLVATGAGERVAVAVPVAGARS